MWFLFPRWPEHPEWLDRYDFAVSQPPQPSFFTDVTERVHLHEGTPVVTYLEARPRWSFWLLRIFGASRFFITAFHWIDDNGHAQTFSRTDLLDTFEILVERYEQLLVLANHVSAWVKGMGHEYGGWEGGFHLEKVDHEVFYAASKWNLEVECC